MLIDVWNDVAIWTIFPSVGAHINRTCLQRKLKISTTRVFPSFRDARVYTHTQKPIIAWLIRICHSNQLFFWIFHTRFNKWTKGMHRSGIIIIIVMVWLPNAEQNWTGEQTNRSEILFVCRNRNHRYMNGNFSWTFFVGVCECRRPKILKMRCKHFSLFVHSIQKRLDTWSMSNGKLSFVLFRNG